MLKSRTSCVKHHMQTIWENRAKLYDSAHLNTSSSDWRKMELELLSSWPASRFNFICARRYKEFSGLRGARRNSCTLMSHLSGSEPSWLVEDPAKNSLCIDGITALYHSLSPHLTCPVRMDVPAKMFVSIVNICVPFQRPTQGPFPEWLRISASIKHTHTFLLNEPWLPSIYTWFISMRLRGNLLLTSSVQNGAHFPPETTRIFHL